MNEQKTASLETIMRRISAMITKADNPATTPEESATYRAKAEELMRKYRIEEEQLIAQDPQGIVPILQTLLVGHAASPFRRDHIWMWNDVALHCGVRSWVKWSSVELGYVAHVVGYAADIRYAEFLFQAARLMMIAKLEPSVDPKLSDADNVYALRSAGLQRNRIAYLLWGSDLGQAGHAAHAKVGKLYAEACAAREEDAIVSGRKVNAAQYRSIFAREFGNRMAQRLREARDAVDVTSGTVQLAGRDERIEEAFYTHFPELRPPEPVPDAPDSDAEPSKGGKQIVKSKPRKITQAQRARLNRDYYSETAQRAMTAGSKAADLVTITRTARANRIEEATEPVGVMEQLEA